MAMGGAPDSILVQAAFAANPRDPLAGLAWTDITSKVRGFDTKIGRQHELGRAEVGTAKIKLDNDDRRFDPDNSSGPYSPNVVPMKRIRIQATYNAITYPIFCGYVQKWPGSQQAAAASEIQVDLVDGFHMFNLLGLGNPYSATVLADRPVGYWRLSESVVTDAVRDLSGRGNPGAYNTSGVTLGQSSPVVDGINAAALFDGAAGQAKAPLAGTVMSIECFVKTSVAATKSTIVGRNLGPGTRIIALSIGDGSGGSAGKAVLTNTSYSVSSAGSIADGNWHHVVGTCDNTGALRIYIDGALSGGPTGNAISNGGDTIQIAGGGTLLGTGPVYFDFFAGTIADVSVYNFGLSATQVAAHYAARTAWPNELTGARIGHLLDVAGWPAADRTVEAGASTMPSLPSPGKALSEMSDAALSENGLLFQGPDGKMNFLQRWHLLTAAASKASQATFGEGAGELRYARWLDVAMDELDIWNDVQMQRAGGQTQYAADTASQDGNGQRTLSQSGLKNTSDLEMWDRANWALNHYKTPLTRVRGITVTPLSDPVNLFPQALGRALWDRITVKRRPPGGGPVFTQDSIIEGIRHKFIPGAWSTTWTLSPTDVQSYLILDDATYGQLDSNRLAY